MKYKATVKKTHNGLQLKLYVKAIFWWPYDGYVPLLYATHIIDEALERWKEHYGDRLTIEDCRK